MALKDFEKRNNPTTLAGWWKNRQPGNNTTLRPACNSDIPKLATLYHSCFGDAVSEAEELLHFFFTQPDFYSFLALRKNVIVSMISLIPARLATGVSYLQGFYLYGIGTLPAFRKQGLSTLLIRTAVEFATDFSYDFLMLVPASRDLCSFYRKQGFVTHSSLNADTALLSHPSFCALTEITLCEYLEHRQSLAAMPGVFSLSAPFTSYSLEMVSDCLAFYEGAAGCFSSDKNRSGHPLPGNSDMNNGFCFRILPEAAPGSGMNRILFEQTVALPSGQIYGGLTHQIYVTGTHPIPEQTYFQFSLDDLCPY